MRIVIAGGTGVLGLRIVPLLLDQGHQVTILARRPEKARSLAALGAEVAAGDVFDAGRVRQVVVAAAPEVVMHQLTDLAGGVGPGNAEVRRAGTRNLVDAARAAGAQRFIVQSIAWACEGGDGPADEATPLDTGAADATRRDTVDAIREMEQAARELPEPVILRNGLLYGPGTWYWAGGAVAKSALAGQLRGSGEVSSFVHVDDAAAAAVAALDWPPGAVNVVDDEPAAASVWVPAFCAAVGAPVPAPVPAQDAAPAGDAAPGAARYARGASNRYARQELGWKPVWPSWRDGWAVLTHEQLHER
jgi:nucleoside-diphosphate-sugar epimerase